MINDEGGRSGDLGHAEAFKIIGNETRLAILRELWAERGRPVTFSELRARVGMRDAAQFNYHLRKLLGPFVRKSDAGYEIRITGLNVVRATIAGTLVEDPVIDPFPVDAACPVCGGGLRGRYERDVVLIECAACGELHVLSALDPGGLRGRTIEEVLAAQDVKLRSSYLLMAAGVCERCAGRTRQTLLGFGDGLPDGVVHADLPAAAADLRGPGALYECEQCDVWYYLTAGEHLLFDPTVIGFYRDHGVDLFRVPLWELHWTLPAATDEYVTVRSEDPLRYELRIPLSDEVLRLTLDGAFRVESTCRESVPPSER